MLRRADGRLVPAQVRKEAPQDAGHCLLSEISLEQGLQQQPFCERFRKVSGKSAEEVIN